jgi:hypothetical protein
MIQIETERSNETKTVEAPDHVYRFISHVCAFKVFSWSINKVLTLQEFMLNQNYHDYDRSLPLIL